MDGELTKVEMSDLATGRSQHIYINGRFLGQRLAGVQRYAAEMSRALKELYPEQITILAPPGAISAGLGERVVGRLQGQLWEQIELPWHARGGFLLNLGNTAPMLKRDQAVVIHDAGAFRTPEAYSWRFRLWYKFLHNYLSRTATRMITVTAFSKAELVKTLQIPDGRIQIAGEGADHMKAIPPRDEILLKKGLRPQGYVLAVGTLAVHKNLSSLGMLSDRLAESGVILAITGAFGASAFSASGGHNLPASARYLGRVNDHELKTLYENAACFVFPSLYEGFGLPPLEAMECGCAVVVADIPALRETCGEAALYCDSRSPANIADTVLSLLNDPPRRAQLQRAARLHIAAFTWKQAAMQLSRNLPLAPTELASQ